MGLVSSKLFALASTRHKRLLLLALVVLAYRTMPKLRWLLHVLHYRLTAETPQLAYRATSQNAKLLQRCDTMTKRKYYPLWYLFNGHLQTVKLAHANDQQLHPAIAYERQLLEMPDGGVVSLDWALPPQANGTQTPLVDIDPRKRTILVLPGLTGGSSELYIRSAVDRLVTLGWQVVVLNARGCADTRLTTAHLFSCAYTGDLQSVIAHLQAPPFAFEALVCLGYSMGANVLVKYLGETGANAHVTAAIAVGNPFDLEMCAQNFQATLLHRLTYDKVMAQNLKTLFFHKSNAHEMFRGFPGVDLAAVQSAATVRAFDHALTRVTFAYASVDAYYADASSLKVLPHVAVPLLCVSARDDPISVALPSTAQVEANPHVILCSTARGGHLAFFEGRAPASSKAATGKSDYSETKHYGGSNRQQQRLEMWSVKVVAEFAESVLALERERRGERKQAST